MTDRNQPISTRRQDTHHSLDRQSYPTVKKHFLSVIFRSLNWPCRSYMSKRKTFPVNLSSTLTPPFTSPPPDFLSTGAEHSLSWRHVNLRVFTDLRFQVRFQVSEDEDHSMVIEVTEIDGVVDRLWLRLVADPEEKVFGGGEQFSYLNLRGQAFPMWTREQGKSIFW